MTDRTGPNLSQLLVSALTILVVIVVCGGVAYWWISSLVDEFSGPLMPTHSVVNEDSPGESDVPVCTDAIADAGGICKGEPLPPCEVEDQNNCYWDAQSMGNRKGSDSVVITLGEDGALAVTPKELPTPKLTDGVND